MKRPQLLLALAVAAGVALLILPPLLSAATVARAAAQTGAPVCIGLIVTSCSTAPARTSPAAFVAVLTLGAWGTMWISRNVEGADEDEEEEAEERVSEGNTHATIGGASTAGGDA
jgi:hypothetical protein